MTTQDNIPPVALRGVKNDAGAQRSSVLGPGSSIERRHDAICSKINDLFDELEALGGRDRLWRELTAKVDEMRLEGESRKKAAGMLSAFDALPCVRETDAMLAREELEHA